MDQYTNRPSNSVFQESKRDPFAVARDEFLNKLAADVRLPARQRASAFKVAWKLTTLANRKMFNETGRLRAWPGLETMAKDLAMTKHTVIEAVRLLEAAGYLFIRQGKPGRNTPNGYRMLIPNSAASALLDPSQEIVHSGEEIVHSGSVNSALSAPEPFDITVEDSPEEPKVPYRSPRKGATTIIGAPPLRSGALPSPSQTKAESCTQREQRTDPSHGDQHYRGFQIPLATEPGLASGVRWSRLSEQIFRVDKWSVCRG
jgi:hypothetical protein